LYPILITICNDPIAVCDAALSGRNKEFGNDDPTAIVVKITEATLSQY